MTSYINNIKNENDSKLFALPGVVGVAVGNKESNGLDTKLVSIKVYVQKKRPIEEIVSEFGANAIIPKTINGIKTDVVESGIIRAQNLISRVRPIIPGYSVGHTTVTAGTIGGVFKDGDGDIVILSNNHVLVNGSIGKICDLCVQPGPLDKSPAGFSGWVRPVSQLDYIGYVKDFEPLFTSGNTQDSAIVKLHPDLVNTSSYRTTFPDGTKYLGTIAATVGMSVEKHGRTTGKTTGTIAAVNGTFTINYGSQGERQFSQCITTGPMSDGGDSGSLLCASGSGTTRQVVGLLFAGSNVITIMNPIDLVYNRYGLLPV